MNELNIIFIGLIAHVAIDGTILRRATLIEAPGHNAQMTIQKADLRMPLSEIKARFATAETTTAIVIDIKDQHLRVLPSGGIAVDASGINNMAGNTAKPLVPHLSKVTDATKAHDTVMFARTFQGNHGYVDYDSGRLDFGPKNFDYGAKFAELFAGSYCIPRSVVYSRKFTVDTVTIGNPFDSRYAIKIASDATVTIENNPSPNAPYAADHFNHHRAVLAGGTGKIADFVLDGTNNCVGGNPPFTTDFECSNSQYP